MSEFPAATHPLRALFYPRSVALVGASERSPWSSFIAHNLGVTGYQGQVFSVNREAKPAHGFPGFSSCRQIAETPDLAYLMVPAEVTLEAFADAAAAGIRNMVVLSSGFAEMSEEGASLQQQLVQRAAELGVRFLGPNSLGFANLSIQAPMTPVPTRLPLLPGKIALISQSGATNAEITEFAHQSGVGLSLYIATGNEAQIDIASGLDFLVDDANTQVIMVFAEAIRDTATFARAARAALARRKPIVILKVGASELTAKVAAAHTGSLVGDDKVFDAVCRQLDVIRVHSIEDLVNTAALLAHTGPLAKPGVGIVSISGGACTLIADRAELHGVALPAFSEDTQARLRAVLPSYAGTLNPLDITGAAMKEPELFEQVLRVLGEDPNLGFIGCVYNLPWNETAPAMPQLAFIGKGLSAIETPAALVNQTTKPLSAKSRELMQKHGIAFALGGIEALVRALGAAAWWSGRVQAARAETRPAAVSMTSARPTSEREVLEFLSARGVPVVPTRLARTREEAVSFAAELDAPVALKIASPDIAHKTEVGGVKLGLRGEEAVAQAYDAILASVRQQQPQAAIEGMLVAPMRSGGLEILAGTVRDPQWGTVLAVGLGGVWVEALADTQLRLLPVTPAEVKSMLLELRGARLLQGFRATPAADLDRLAQVIARIGDAALALGPELETLEVNPLWVQGAQVEALDGLTVWRLPS
jgi:acyl-CoA synthetase (NDP forming)